MSVLTMSQIRDVLVHFLKRCDITYPNDIRLDYSFRDACYADATRRGFDLATLKRSLDVGIAIADAAYQHLKSQPARIFIAIWTGILTYIDDEYHNYAGGLDEFFDRFLRQEPQQHQILDQIATLFRGVPDHWGVISSNLITTAQMDFLTSTIIDRTIEGVDVSDLNREHDHLIYFYHRSSHLWRQTFPYFLAGCLAYHRPIVSWCSLLSLTRECGSMLFRT